MKKNIYAPLFLLGLSIGILSCEPDELGIMNGTGFTDKTGELQAATNVPIGMSISYNTFMNDAKFNEIVKREANSVTFEYEMKHAALVDNNGNIDFSRADALYNAATAAGAEVFGHTLGWHMNQNGVYLNSLGGSAGGNAAPNLVANPGFEAGGGSLTDWSVMNTGNPAGSATITATTAATDIRGGVAAMKVVNPTAYPGSQWRVQAGTKPFAVEPGKTYNVSYWVKAAEPNGSIRLSTQPNAKYQGDQAIGTNWQQVTWSFTADAGQTEARVIFDMGQAANTYFIDDVKVVDPNYVAPTLLTNPGFEAGGGSLTGWTVMNTGNPAGSATITATTAATDIRGGVAAMKVVNPTAYPGSQWRVQAGTNTFAVEPGKTYNVSYWIKAAEPNGSIRLSTQPNAKYQGDQAIGTDWQQVTWSFTADAGQTEARIVFDMGQAANTYFIDDVKVDEAGAGGGDTGGGDAATVVDAALNDFITKTVTHYKGKVKAWDVVNEVVTDAGSLRTSDNTTIPQGEKNDYFFWADLLGEDWILKAFQYAAAADPDALLFINDYNLESSPAKLNALLALVEEMREKGAKIDGIGTQMHISINTSRAAIDDMFKKLAATGLLVRISELDIRVNPSNKPDFSTERNNLLLDYQAEMYNYVINSYFKHVPAAQRHGITIWGVIDPESWIVKYQDRVDAPLLFDGNYEKKPAYSGVLNALKSNK